MKKPRIKIYLSGGMSSLTKEENTMNFKFAEEWAQKNFSMLYEKVTIINPVEKPFKVVDGLDYEDCLEIDFACIRVCDLIVMIPGWENSIGASRELNYAKAMKKEVYYIEGVDTI